jgi:hypothetical protein
MIHAFFPEKDSTIYEIAPNANTGLDEILELQKRLYTIDSASKVYPYNYESRILIKFKNSEIASFISSNNVNINDCKFLLNLYSAAQTEVPYEYVVQAYMVSGSWTNGTGRRYGQQITDGVTWNSATGASASYWSTASADTGKFWYNVQEGGGNWYTTTYSTASFLFDDNADLQLDVTDQIKSWYNGSRPNDGFIIKFESSSFIQPSFPNTNLSYYSSNTKTVFSPQLHLCWNTGSYNTAMGEYVFRNEPVIYIKNFRSEYKENQKHRVYLGTRPKFPRPTFTQTNEYAVSRALPSASYYQLIDAHTMDTIIPYSEYTKISADASGSYFDFWTSPFYPERWYKFEFKAIYSDSTEYYTSNDYIFKVID